MKNFSRTFIILITLVAVSFVLWYFRTIVGYVCISWVFAMIGTPIKHLYQRIKIGQFRVGTSIASGMTILTILVIIGFLLSMFVPMILAQARTFADVDYIAVGENLEEPINRINARLIKLGLLNPDKASPIDQLQNDVLNQLGGMLSSVFGSVLSLTSTVLIGLFSILFITFFFLRDEGLFQNALLAVVPNSQELKVINAISQIQNLLTRYFIGILGQISIITFLVTLGLSVLGIQNSLLIGFFAGVINVIPYLGPMIGGAFGILMAISSNLQMEFYPEMLPMIGKVALVFVVMQMVDNFFLQPMIFSQSVKAHPLEIFIVILIGAELYGIVGMVLAIPVYTVLRVMLGTFLNEFKLVQRLTKGINPPPI